MDNDSPFSGRDLPIIGQPTVLNMSAIVLLQCNCEDKTLLMGPVGAGPFVCPKCNKNWAVDLQVQIAVQQVLPTSPILSN